jgi:tetratricopeptide (TPR) repeat protein
MRYSIHVIWLLPLLGAAALGADDLPQPKKDPAASAAPAPVLPGPRPAGVGTPDPGTAELQRLLRDLRAQRDALRNDRAADERAPAPPGSLSSNEVEIARLRKRMQELAARSRPDAKPPVLLPPDTSLAPPAGGDAGNGGTLDAVAVAQNYFRAHDYEAALAAYRKVPLREALAEERAPILYMIATCLRKLGKRDEAAKAYREAAAVKGDPFVAECAQWQLQTLAWRADLEAQLAQIRERRKPFQTKP